MAINKIVTNFGDAGVHESKDGLARYFRTWESIKQPEPVWEPEWPRLQRRLNVRGYPPFDIFSDWLMDFGSIAAALVGRNDWQPYIDMVLVHVPGCSFNCWYCFNDAWPSTRGVMTAPVDYSELVREFLHYRKLTNYRYNSLRISGGEPFMEPEVIEGIASAFKKLAREDEGPQCFLWIDTNLAPLKRGRPRRISRAIKAIKDLKNRCAIHACLHGADDVSLWRNTGSSTRFQDLVTNLQHLVDSGINVFPRINPAALTPTETRSLFAALHNVAAFLPAATYLGPLSLEYPAAIQRMNSCGRTTGGKDPEQTGTESRVPIQPFNASIVEWDRCMEDTYGWGYAVVPRNLGAAVVSERAPLNLPEALEWHSMLLVSKGWIKEVYALKMLESLALPKGAVVEFEYENKWVEPSVVATSFSAPREWAGTRVLLLAAAQNPGGEPKMVPIRWADLLEIRASGLKANHTTCLRFKVSEYASESEAAFWKRGAHRADGASLAEFLARVVGWRRIPFTGKHTSYFCSFVALPGAARESLDDDFKQVVSSMQQISGEYGRRDVYFRIKAINDDSAPGSPPAFDDTGVLELYEGSDIVFELEAFNPSIGEPGHVDIGDTKLKILSTEPGKVGISPSEIRLGKYGTSEVHATFHKKGEYRGILTFTPENSAMRIPEIQIPFHVAVREG